MKSNIILINTFQCRRGKTYYECLVNNCNNVCYMFPEQNIWCAIQFNDVQYTTQGVPAFLQQNRVGIQNIMFVKNIFFMQCVKDFFLFKKKIFYRNDLILSKIFFQIYLFTEDFILENPAFASVYFQLSDQGQTQIRLNLKAHNFPYKGFFKDITQK